MSHGDDLQRLEGKLDRLFDLHRLERKLDALLQDRLDRDEVARLAGELHRSTRRLARAVEDASSALPDGTATQLTSFATQERSETDMALTPEMQRLKDEVAENKTIMESATTLLTGLSQRLRDNADDAAAVRGLADELDANSNALAAAITANTPAEGETPPTP